MTKILIKNTSPYTQHLKSSDGDKVTIFPNALAHIHHKFMDWQAPPKEILIMNMNNHVPHYKNDPRGIKSSNPNLTMNQINKAHPEAKASHSK